jgi:hypothetical protein
VSIDDTVVEEVVIPEIEETEELSETELAQFRRLDKSLRSKLGWLIDRETND